MAPKLVKKCKNCGSTNFVKAVTQTANDVSCANCGLVIEENPITADLSYSENSSGGTSLNGKMIRLDQSGASSLKSREITIQNARRKINALASALRIPSTIAEAAANWFSLALANNFVKGRKSQNVIASCLYIACRKEKTHHMLIDFSSKLQVSVYSIGSTFLKMVKSLHIVSLPLADPSLFINHFVDRLNFEGKRTKVLNDAIKLAQRMSQDWLYEGRRPAGIAGACVLLAARMNNFRRTHDEIVALAHVGEETIQKRLNEFKQTNASSLSIKEFRNTSNESIEPSLPPAYTKQYKKPTASYKRTEKYHKESASLIERYMNEELSSSDILAAVQRIMTRLDNDEKDSKKRKTVVAHVRVKDLPEKEDKSIDELTEDNNTKSISISSEVPRLSATNLPSKSLVDILDYESDEETFDQFEDKTSLATKDETEQLKMIEANRPRNLLAVLPKSSELLLKVPDHDHFSDIDDNEIETFLLSEQESKIKEQIFVNLNQDYLLALEQKRLKEESDALTGHVSKPSKRRKIKSSGEFDPEATSLMGSLGEGPDMKDITVKAINGVISELAEKNEIHSAQTSMKNMLRSRQSSSKLNYKAIDTLFNS